MPNLNKVMLIGNVTRDPEARHTQNGTAVADLGMAINRTFTKDGEKREEVTFVDVELWGRLAEIAVQYVKKGRPLFIEGRLKLDSWEDKSGQKRQKLKVVGEGIQLLGSKGAESKLDRPADVQFPPKEEKKEFPVNMGFDDDIPF
jgi:single-strand DNA-binding protein